MRVLVVNAGSSSVKIRLLDPDNMLLHEVNLDADRGQPQASAVTAAIKTSGLSTRPDTGWCTGERPSPGQ